jgi:hypothetical protein
MALSLLVPLLAFYVLSRFRVPLLATLIPFAGLTVSQIVCWARKKQRVPAGIALASGLVMWLVIGRPLPPGAALITYYDCCYAPYVAYYASREQAARQKGDRNELAGVLEEMVRHVPPVVQRMGPAQPAGTDEEARMALGFAATHRRYAHVLKRLGRTELAEAHKRRAADLARAAGKAARQGKWE